MTLALTPTGLVTDTQAAITNALAQQIQATFGVNTNVSPSSIMGQLINIIAELNAFNQQVLLAVYRRFDPNSAVGVALDALASLTGSVRQGASASFVEGLIEFGGPGNVPDGSLILNEDNNTQWQSILGPYTDTGGPYPEFVPAVFQATNTGPIIANAGTTWSVVTVIPNFTGFTNPTDDANLGQNQESDAAFRIRRGVELYSQNIGPLLSIQGVVSKVNTDNGRVTTVRVYHNPATNPVDSDGIPFKAFNVLVETDPPLPLPQVAGPIEPLAQDIADAIFSATGAGGQAYGTDYGVVEEIFVIDVEGFSQGPIAFDVVQEVDVYIDIDVITATTIDDGPVVPENPVTMADVIRDNVASVAQGYKIIGRDGRALDHQGTIQQLILAGELSGVMSAVVGVSTTNPSPGPAITTLTAPLTIRQKADYDTGTIRVFIDGVEY